jgi:hypothetical protein
MSKEVSDEYPQELRLIFTNPFASTLFWEKSTYGQTCDLLHCGHDETLCTFKGIFAEVPANSDHRSLRKRKFSLLASEV